MSDLTNKQPDRNKKIVSFCVRIINADNPVEAVKSNQHLIDSINYKDVIRAVDELVKLEIPMEKLKKGINRILNLFYLSLSRNKEIVPAENSFLDYLTRNNKKLESQLKELRPLIRQINKTGDDVDLKKSLLKKFKRLYKYDSYYVIKENILFPVLEKQWADYRCLQVMWSFHDDIRTNLKKNIELLEQEEMDLKLFNRLTGDIFFNMLAIKFREEKILFPHILDTISTNHLDNMLSESLSFEWPFVQPDPKEVIKSGKSGTIVQGEMDLLTGSLFPEQIRLMINHLPVDITYVDEHNKVRYFSAPQKRIFPRTNAIIGREVRNCHPQGSMHIVDEIIESFRSGKQGKAQFCIKMREEYILIQYFAVRDELGKYKGVIEVSQEIADIQKIKEEKRLLDWDHPAD